MLLLIDDEPGRMNAYIEELRLSNFVVHVERSAELGLQFFSNNKDRIELVILDILMPAGDLVPPEPGRTGVVVFDKIRNESSAVPVLVFTNVSDSALTHRFGRDRRT